MKIEKIRLDELFRCYSTAAITLDDELHLFYASEEKDYPCFAYSGKDFQNKKVVWEKGGGTMSMIPIPHRKNQFLAVNGFYLKESPSGAHLSWVTYEKDKGFTIKDILYLPYLHRFDLYEDQGKIYFVGATIATTKKDKEDWSSPGKIYAAQLPNDLNEPLKLEVIAEGLTRNHGYSRSPQNDGGYFTCDQGIFKVTVPSVSGKWQIEKIMDKAVGEIAIVDIDNDGIEELMTIEPFHGNVIKIYKKIDGIYKDVYSYPYVIDFAHTLVGTQIRGINSFVGGVRREASDLFMVQYLNGKFETTIIDKGVGPANLNVFHLKDCDLIHSSNHTQNEAAVYVIRDEESHA